MIPYTVDRRTDTGVSNVTMGIWLFLASEVMLFGAMFSAYALLRVSAVSWPHGPDVLNVTLGALNTAILIMMAALVWRARASKSIHRAILLMIVASAFAVFFLGVKTLEYTDDISRGLVPALNTFLATYFALTGLHALHVVGGLVANLWVVFGARRAGETMTRGRLQALSLYWAFVDAVWLIIVVLMYLS